MVTWTTVSSNVGASCAPRFASRLGSLAEVARSATYALPAEAGHTSATSTGVLLPIASARNAGSSSPASKRPLAFASRKYTTLMIAVVVGGTLVHDIDAESGAFARFVSVTRQYTVSPGAATRLNAGTTDVPGGDNRNPYTAPTRVDVVLDADVSAPPPASNAAWAVFRINEPAGEVCARVSGGCRKIVPSKNVRKMSAACTRGRLIRPFRRKVCRVFRLII